MDKYKEHVGFMSHFCHLTSNTQQWIITVRDLKAKSTMYLLYYICTVQPSTIQILGPLSLPLSPGYQCLISRCFASGLLSSRSPSLFPCLSISLFPLCSRCPRVCLSPSVCLFPFSRCVSGVLELCLFMSDLSPGRHGEEEVMWLGCVWPWAIWIKFDSTDVCMAQD